MAPPKPVPQENLRTDLYVNLKGRGLKHGFTDRPVPLIIRGTYSSAKWTDTINKYKPGFQQVPSSLASQEELNFSETDPLLLVVGLVPADLDFKFDIANAATKKTKTAADDNIEIHQDDVPQWYRVATPIPTRKNNKPLEASMMTKLYCLFHTGPEGYCVGGLINADNVFYFAEYRTSTKAINQRRAEWLGKVKTAINTYLETEAVAELNNTIIKPKVGVPMIIVKPTIDLSNKLKLLAAALAKQDAVEPALVKQLAILLEIEHHDLESLDDWHLTEFLNPDASLEGPDDAQNVVDAALKRWPYLAVTKESVLLLKRGLEEAALIVPYAHLSGSLAVGHDMIVKLATSGTSNEESKSLDDVFWEKLVTDARSVVALARGPTFREPGASIDKDPDNAIIEAIVHHLEKISESYAKNETALLDSAGKQGTTLTLDECTEMYAGAVDKDMAVLASGQGMRVLQKDQARVLQSLKSSIDDLLAVLLQLVKSSN